MEIYEASKKGRLIAWAGDHFVYAYGKDEVIKFSKFDFFLGYERALKKAVDDYALCKKYFDEFLLDTRIVVSLDTKFVALIQKKISGTHLAARDLRKPDVLRNYRDLVERYHDMTAREHTFLDLIRQKGLWRGVVSNIFVTPDNQLLLFDATLFDVHEFPLWLRPFFFLLFVVGYCAQEITLWRFERHSNRQEHIL